MDCKSLQTIYYNGSVIPLSQSVKNLGLLIDSKLTWRPQINAVSSKVNAVLHSLYKLKNFIPFKTKLMLIQSLVLPIIDYGDVCYPDLTNELLNKLERLLNNCIRFIFGLRKYDHISEYRRQLKWLPIQMRRNSRILFVLFSIINNTSSPPYLRENFQYRCETHDRVLRSSSNLKAYILPHNTGFFHYSFIIQAILLWNTLPEDIRKSSTLWSFKKKVREHLFSTDQ